MATHTHELFQVLSLLIIFLNVSSTSAHMYLSYPIPLRGLLTSLEAADALGSPLNVPSRTGSNFPCLGDLPKVSTAPITPLVQSSIATIHLNGTSPHDGGSCQISLSMDGGKQWKVLKSMMGACPRRGPEGLGDGKGQGWTYRVPGDVSGTGLLGWSWINRLGEFYMNCAKVEINPATEEILGKNAGGGRTRLDKEAVVKTYSTTNHADFVTLAPPPVDVSQLRRRRNHWQRHNSKGYSEENPAQQTMLPEVKWEDRPDMLVLDLDIVDCRSPATKESDKIQYETEYPEPGDDVEYAEDGQYQLRLPTGKDCINRKREKTSNVPDRPTQDPSSAQPIGMPGYRPNLPADKPKIPSKPKPSCTRTKTAHASHTSSSQKTFYVTSRSTTTAIITATRTAMNSLNPTITSTVTVYGTWVPYLFSAGSPGETMINDGNDECDCVCPDAEEEAKARKGNSMEKPPVIVVDDEAKRRQPVTVTGVYTVSVTVTSMAPLPSV